jgi:serine/threonine protein kinase
MEQLMQSCTQCSTTLTGEPVEGLCPACLLKAGLAVLSSQPPVDPDPTQELPRARASAADINIANLAEVARLLPQFEILEFLGRGGMGVVYKARQIQLDRVVAIKIIPPGDAVSPGFIERFRREARSLAKLNHPHIVNVFDFGETNGLYYLLMELVDGLNLRQMMRAAKLTPPQALAVVPQICEALQYAHEEGVVHRDIKPENILLDKKGRVKIADFGLAKLLRREPADHTLTMAGAMLGTPKYMAPEQIEKPGSVDHRADIYSLGVVFYEMLTGEIPMGRFAPPSQKVQVDVRLDEIVLHAMERDVDRRYQHASEVSLDIERVTLDEQHTATAAPASPAPSRTTLHFDPFSSPASTTPLPRMHVSVPLPLAYGGGGAPPAAPPSTLEQVTAISDRRFPLGYFCLCCLLFALTYALALACWNLREWGILAAGAVMTGAVGVALFLGRRHFPIIGFVWRGRSNFARAGRLLTALISCVASQYFVLGATLIGREMMTGGPFFQNVDGFQSAYSGKEYQLLRQLPGYTQSIPMVEMQRTTFNFNGSLTTSPFLGIAAGVEGVTLAVVIIFLVQLFAGLSLVANGAFALLQTKPYGLRQPGWRMFIWPVAVIGLAQPVAWFAQMVLTGFCALILGMATTTPVSTTKTQVKAPLDSVAKTLQTAMGMEGFDAYDSADWDIRTVPQGKKIASVRLLLNRRPSAFDLWRWKNGILVNAYPNIAVELICDEVSNVTTINIQLVQKSDGQVTAAPWPGVTQRLLTAASSAKAVTTAPAVTGPHTRPQ